MINRQIKINGMQKNKVFIYCGKYFNKKKLKIRNNVRKMVSINVKRLVNECDFLCKIVILF